MNQIRQFFEQLTPLRDEEWAAMAGRFRWVTYPKGKIILSEGEHCDFIGFIREGLFRFYHLKDGSEKVTAFWFPGEFLSNYRSFVSGQPSSHFIEAMEDGAVWTLRKRDLEELYAAFPVFERLGRLMAERLYGLVAQRLDAFMQETPEERYQALLERNSRLIQEIPQYMIASYLGVSAETLSRIRKRLAG
jgi:CRP-like cAMP-binding protein